MANLDITKRYFIPSSLVLGNGVVVCVHPYLALQGDTPDFTMFLDRGEDHDAFGVLFSLRDFENFELAIRVFLASGIVVPGYAFVHSSLRLGNGIGVRRHKNSGHYVLFSRYDGAEVDSVRLSLHDLRAVLEVVTAVILDHPGFCHPKVWKLANYIKSWFARNRAAKFEI